MAPTPLSRLRLALWILPLLLAPPRAWAQLGFTDLAAAETVATPIPMVAGPTALTSGTHDLSLRHGARDRAYRVHVPPGPRPAAGWPTVVAFHGLFMDGPGLGAMTRLHRLGEQQGFATVYPSGTGSVEGALSWNAGRCCLEAQLRGVDDVGFGGALLETLTQDLPADPARLYLMGFSNGGMLVYRLLDGYADRIAAAAVVAAVDFQDRPAHTRSVPLVALHGTQDPYVPLTGNLSSFRLGWPRMPPVRERLLARVRAYGGDATPRTRTLPGDRAHVTHETWAAAEGGAAVELYTVKGGGHSWPGGPAFATHVLGEPDPGVDATAVSWEFLKGYRLPPADS